ncbi:E3 binding domain-containing protein [Mesorhizobium sp. PAMC28654]|uniref:E3 binding domain-containing protein n=1 Tax=Mesorhizobium sp. PAMC28654 TaxID=2880934 RepID=UPI001D0B952A|nr:E3 binding domain-containing protein [Mesorhizobium sp. PAMC28654]UDL86958.1 E3 binding domain-containing protein [Mesorhizobium sp. PAMC28654]
MNIAVAQARRQAVSPYARRLARERSLPLDVFRGSGPGGRVLAVDVLGFVPVAEPVEPPTVAVAALRIAAFAASIALGALNELLAALESAGKTLDIDDILLRATGRAFAEIPDIAKVADAPVALELMGRQAVFATAPEMPLTSLRAMRFAALADNRDDTERPAALSLRLFPAGDIRPLTMPLLSGRAMRLTVSVNTAGDHAECFLTADAASVDEAAAAAWLIALKSTIEHPFRLFV